MRCGTPEESMSFADRLKELREQAGLSQEQLAERAGLNPWTVAKLEQGQRPDPAWSTVCALADGLGLEVGQFRIEAAPREPRLGRPPMVPPPPPPTARAAKRQAKKGK